MVQNICVFYPGSRVWRRLQHMLIREKLHVQPDGYVGRHNHNFKNNEHEVS